MFSFSAQFRRELFRFVVHTHTHTHTHTVTAIYLQLWPFQTDSRKRSMTGQGWAWERCQLPWWWCVCVCQDGGMECLSVFDCPSPGPSVWVWMGVWSVSVFLTQFLHVKQITIGNAHKLCNSKLLSPKAKKAFKKKCNIWTATEKHIHDKQKCFNPSQKSM